MQHTSITDFQVVSVLILTIKILEGRIQFAYNLFYRMHFSMIL